MAYFVKNGFSKVKAVICDASIQFSVQVNINTCRKVRACETSLFVVPQEKLNQMKINEPIVHLLSSFMCSVLQISESFVAVVMRC